MPTTYSVGVFVEVAFSGIDFKSIAGQVCGNVAYFTATILM